MTSKDPPAGGGGGRKSISDIKGDVKLPPQRSVTYDDHGDHHDVHKEGDDKIEGLGPVLDNLHHDVIKPKIQKTKNNVGWVLQMMFNCTLIPFVIPKLRTSCYAPPLTDEEEINLQRERRNDARKALGLDNHVSSADGQHFEHSLVGALELQTMGTADGEKKGDKFHWDDVFDGKVVLVVNLGMFGDATVKGGCA